MGVGGNSGMFFLLCLIIWSTWKEYVLLFFFSKTSGKKIICWIKFENPWRSVIPPPPTTTLFFILLLAYMEVPVSLLWGNKLLTVLQGEKMLVQYIFFPSVWELFILDSWYFYWELFSYFQLQSLTK